MKMLPIEQANQYLDKWYKGCRWSLSGSETNLYKEQFGNFTYGEITESSAEKLIAWLNVTDSDTLYDLGCGLGKLVVQVYLRTNIKNIYGVELAESRFKQAKSILSKIHEISGIHEGRKIDFYQADISKFLCVGPTIVYMCSTCFSPELLNQIVENLLKSAPLGLRLVSLKRLPNPQRFHLLEKRDLAMTWSSSSPVYLYKLMKTNSSIDTEAPEILIDSSSWDDSEEDQPDWSSEN